MINTLDNQFFEANIPEAFSARKLAHGEKQNKMVEILPFFHRVITTSNMIANGKSLFDLNHPARQQERKSLLWVQQVLRSSRATLTQEGAD
jgi:hypothetical protein